MFQKQQLTLIIAALLPVCILGIGFIGFSVMAGLNPGETANPADSGAYYRTPGANGRYFGPEVQSNTLCPGALGNNTTYNHGFDIIRTEENATVTGAIAALNWNRTQNWSFASTEVWGTNSSYIILNTTIGSGGMGRFPWNGTEKHWRNGNKVESQTDVYTWDNQPAPNGTDWACPDYRRYGGWLPNKPIWYDCNTAELHLPLLAQGGDWLEELTTYVAGNPPHTEGQQSGNWYDCISTH